MEKININKSFCNAYLNDFWFELSPNSKKLVLSEYLRNKESNEQLDNSITLCNNTLVIEKGMGFHKFWSHNLDNLVKDRILTGQAFIDGTLTKEYQGNVAPFCVHFVTSPFDFKIDNLKSAFRNIEDKRLLPDDGWGVFYRGLYEFNAMDYFMYSDNRGFIKNFPIIFTYKRKNNDIDVLNDSNLDIHTDFRKNNYIIFNDGDGINQFKQFMNCTMAILGGINVDNLDGIIICEGFWDGSSFNWSLHEFIDYLIKNFPKQYIANENGEILYKPECIKVKTLNHIDNPFKLRTRRGF